MTNDKLKMTNRRKFIQGVTAIAGLSLTSCGWKLADVKADSSNKGSRDKLNIYTWSQYIDNKLLQSFTTQTGIKVSASVYDSNEFMLAKLRAGGGGSYGIVYPSDYMVQKMADAGLLSEINLDNVIGLENLYNQFKNPTYDPNNRYSIPFSWGTTGLIYNSEVLKEAPINWDYLWQKKEELSQRMTLLNDIREVTGAVLRMLGYSYNSKSENELKHAYAKLQELKPYIAAFDTDSWRNQILAGDLLIAMCYSADAVPISKENPQLKYVVPQSGSSLWTDTIAIPKTSPNPDGAYAWINFMLQPDIGAQISKRLSIATPYQQAFELLPKQLQNNTTLFPPESIVNNCERIQPLGDFEEIYERYWTELTSS